MQGVRAKLEWFKAVILPQEAALRGRLRRILPANQELEDMVAEVLARAYATDNWENVTTGRAYLFTIARNLVIDTARRNKVVSFETIADLELLQGQNDVEAQLHAREALRQVAGETYPSAAIVARYRELGGEHVVVGSDAHRVNAFAWGLADGYDHVRAAGFDALAFRRGGAPESVPLVRTPNALGVRSL